MPKNKLELVDDAYCFVCGKKNPIGLKLRFETVNGEHVTEFTPGPEHQGWAGITHGGILSAVADEVMARLVWMEGLHAVTAEMTIRFKHPARIGVSLRAAGRIEAESGRTINCKAIIQERGGRLIAEASARMLKV